MRLMLCLYFAYVLSFILNHLVRGTLFRHLFATITGMLMQLFMYRGAAYHPLVMTAVTYLLMTFLPRNVQNKVVMVFVMGYLSGQHIYSIVTNFGGWEMEITTYTMILTAKLSALAFCYKDGGVKDEADLLPEQKERLVKKMPSPLELLSYV